jgi:hypothetical protein
MIIKASAVCCARPDVFSHSVDPSAKSAAILSGGGDERPHARGGADI